MLEVSCVRSLAFFFTWNSYAWFRYAYSSCKFYGSKELLTLLGIALHLFEPFVSWHFNMIERLLGIGADPILHCIAHPTRILLLVLDTKENALDFFLSLLFFPERKRSEYFGMSLFLQSSRFSLH